MNNGILPGRIDLGQRPFTKFTDSFSSEKSCVVAAFVIFCCLTNPKSFEHISLLEFSEYLRKKTTDDLKKSDKLRALDRLIESGHFEKYDQKYIRPTATLLKVLSAHEVVPVQWDRAVAAPHALI